MRPFPFGSSLSSGFGWLRITTPQRTFSCLVHSHFPDRFCRPVRLLRLFFPLSTRVYQAHAEGRGCLPFTREAGVVAIPLMYACGIIDLHGYAVTKVKRLPPLSPCLCRQFRANRSHTQRSQNVTQKTRKSDRVGQYSIRINDLWRICFKWSGNKAKDVEIVDYHR